MSLHRWKYLHILLVCLCWLISISSPVSAQSYDEEDIEVYLDFKHRGVIQTVIIAYYKDDKFFLPYNELFTLLQIDHNVNVQESLLYGDFLEEETYYEIQLNDNLETPKAIFGDNEYPLTKDDYLFKEIDYYIESSRFNDIFGLDFTIDLNNLSVTLISRETLPIVKKLSRRNRRSQIVSNQRKAGNLNYPIAFDRERKILNGGFLDYNISTVASNNANLFTYNSSLGLEFLGGDVQGSVSGTQSADASNFSTQGLRWRYVRHNSNVLTSTTIGQTNSTGLLQSAFTGLQLNNQPIEPRRLFGEYNLAGSTEPGSEVEVYVNNSLVDFQEADVMGNYNFLLPVSYGSSQLDVRIFGPTGRIRERTTRLQIPFSFTPKGEVNYNLNVGQLDNAVLGDSRRGLLAQGDVSVGLTDWLSTRVGTEYYEDFHNTIPTFTSSVTARILSNYLVTTEVANEAFFRTNASVVYPSAASVSVDYREFFSEGGIYNPTGSSREFSANLFYPIRIFGRRTNVRLFGTRRIRQSIATTRYRVDLNTRVGRWNVRGGFSDSQVGSNFFELSQQSRVFSSLTYNFSRSKFINPLVRGVFFRGQVSYLNKLNSLEELELLVSKSIFDTGRFQVAAGRNFIGEFTSLTFNLAFDFNKTRATSTFRSLGTRNNITQNLRGSVAFDSRNKNVILSSRQQVGRSGLALRLFTDNNNNGIFDEGDDTIDDNAIRLDRSGATSASKDGIVYITQVQSYFKYNLEVNKGAIKNPLLIPSLEKFGLIADPNYFKPIDVPFYSSGVVEGVVERVAPNGERSGIAGLKLIASSTESDYVKEFRTFSDGSFYDYEIPPGKYEVVVDEASLNILNVASYPEKIEFEIKRLAEGDFVEGLYFELISKDSLINPTNPVITTEAESIPSTSDVTTPPPVGLGSEEINQEGSILTLNYNIEVINLTPDECSYGLQLGAYLTLDNANKAKEQFASVNPLIVYNSSRRLFALRSGLYPGMAASTSQARSLISPASPNISVVNRCYEASTNAYYSKDSAYQLQFAAFGGSETAQSYSRFLNESLNINSYVTQDEKDELYKVRLGPYEDLDEVLEIRKQLLNSTDLEDIFLSKTTTSSVRQINVDFEFMLQVGEFKDTDQAIRYAIRLDGDFDLKTKILIDENEKVQLVADEGFANWEEVISLKERIEAIPGYQAPIVQLIEKPAN